MQIIDSQVHCFDHPRDDAPWAVEKPILFKCDGSEMVAAMAAVGVAGAIMVSPFSVYGYHPGFAKSLARSHPGRFGLVIPVDPRAENVAEAISDWATVNGAVGIRLMMAGPDHADGASLAVMAKAAAAAGRHGLAVNLMCTGNLAAAGQLALRHPDVQLVIDHLGLSTPFDRVPDSPFADLSAVLALAKYPNVAIKVSGACALSHAGHPFDDLWPHLARVFDAYGMARCMWGTDWTRTLALVTYGQAVECFRTTPRLSPEDRAMLMGGAVQRIYGWSPA